VLLVKRLPTLLKSLNHHNKFALYVKVEETLTFTSTFRLQ